MNMKENERPDKECVSVIIPAFNEEAAIKSQVNAIRDVLTSHGIVYEIIVVDDNSEDSTADYAYKAGAHVLKHSENRGYGASLKTAINVAKYETIVIIDADKTYPADQIPTLLTKLKNADMVVGARIGKQVHIPLIRRPAKWILGLLANRISGKTIPDLNSGLRAFRRECVMQYLSILPNRVSFTTTITLAMLGDDYRVVYHTIDYHRRVGKSKITPRNFMDFLILVLRMAMLFQPLKVFLPVAVFCSVLGFIKIGLDVLGLFQRAEVFCWKLIFQPTLSTSALLLLLAGLQLLLIGMVADGLLRRISRTNRPLIASHAICDLESLSNQESNNDL